MYMTDKTIELLKYSFLQESLLISYSIFLLTGLQVTERNLNQNNKLSVWIVIFFINYYQTVCLK